MSFLSAVTDVLRPRSAAGDLGIGPRAIAREQEPSTREKRAMLHLSNVSHAVNHFQNQMMTMLYPYIMADLGMSYTAVGVLSAICSVLSSVCQGASGFLTPFVSRDDRGPRCRVDRIERPASGRLQHPLELLPEEPRGRDGPEHERLQRGNPRGNAARDRAPAGHGLATDLLRRHHRERRHGPGLLFLPRLRDAGSIGFWTGSARPGLRKLPESAEGPQHATHRLCVHGRRRRP